MIARATCLLVVPYKPGDDVWVFTSGRLLEGVVTAILRDDQTGAIWGVRSNVGDMPVVELPASVFARPAQRAHALMAIRNHALYLSMVQKSLLEQESAA